MNELVRGQFIRGIRSSTVQLRLMRERPKTLNEALQLAGQYQGVEESQKRLHGASAKVETMAVTGKKRVESRYDFQMIFHLHSVTECLHNVTVCKHSVTECK